jgi:hypothetical protein
MIAELADGRKLEFPDGTDPAVIQRTVKNVLAQGSKAVPADTEVAINAGNKGIAGIPDVILNTPNRAMNIIRAVGGGAATALGKPEWAPELSPDPNYISRGMKSLGFIRDTAEPTNARQRIIDMAAQGGTSAAINPVGTIRQLAQNVITGLAGGSAGQATTEATGSEAIGQSVGMLAPTAVNAVGNRARDRIVDLEAQRGANAVRDKTFAEAREQGYKFPRSATQDTLLNNIAESFAGKDALKQKMTIGNQEVTNRLAAEELGLPRGTAITHNVLDKFRDSAAQPYREVSALSPAAESALERLKQTRFDIKTFSKHANISGDPNSVKQVENLQQKADVLETALEKIATRSGNPDLVNRLRESRTKIAKAYDIEKAMNIGNAEISAPDLGGMLNRRGPGGMSGNLDLIARTQQNASRFMGEGSKTPAPGVNHLDSYGSALSAIGGSFLGGIPGGLVGAVALPTARKLTRAALMSDFLQKRASPNYNPNLATRAAANIQSQTPEQQMIQSILLDRAMAERNKGAQ